MKTFSSPLQISVDIVVAMILGQVNKNTCSTTSFTMSAETAIADPSARRALPVLEEEE